MVFMANYYDQICTDRSPDLCFDSIDALPIERFYSQVLFDPFKEQLDLPAAFVIVGNLAGITIWLCWSTNNILIVFLDQSSEHVAGFPGNDAYSYFLSTG
jgi:hypothetical protein